MDPLLIVGKRIDLDRSAVLYDAPFTVDSLARDWRVRGGEWRVEDGWLHGSNPENCPGMVTSVGGFADDVLLDFEARTVAPSTHDIDWMWNGSWDEATNTRSTAYVAGLQGWWEGKVGFEKAPDYRLIAATPLFPFEPGRTYRIQSGSIEGHVFVFVDGRLVLELRDPDPIDSAKCPLIGFEAYASRIAVRNLVVRRIAWSPRELSYPREF